MGAFLRMEDVTVIRDGKRILGPITWSLQEGERWVIIGPNGAGKTTFLQLVGAMIHPSSGSVEILGSKLGAVDVFELRPRIGISSSALQELFPRDERVIDLVLTAAYAVTGRWVEEYDLWDESRAKALLDIFGVRELAARSYGTLSEGERKRVQIARALMADPEIILFDEPAAGLDLGGREDILERISRFLEEDLAPASLMVTHHIEEIPRGTTHVLLLNTGEIFASGKISSVLTEDNLNKLFSTNIQLSFDGTRYSAVSRR
jgi:iron complex transport system ATP-binding protein